MWSRGLSWCVWALVGASVVYWGLQFFAPHQGAPIEAQVAVPKSIQRGDLTRIFGPDEAPASTEQATPPPDKRFTLVGVVAPRARAGSQAAREGIALISVDSKPAKAYRVGAVVDGDTLVQAVNVRSVALGPKGGPATVSLEIPPLPVAAPAPQGTLSSQSQAAGPLGAASTALAVTPVSVAGAASAAVPGAPRQPRASRAQSE
jgi:general secretion pathway protein C